MRIPSLFCMQHLIKYSILVIIHCTCNFHAAQMNKTDKGRRNCQIAYILYIYTYTYLNIWCRDENIDSLNCSVVLLSIDIALARTPFSQNAMTYNAITDR